MPSIASKPGRSSLTPSSTCSALSKMRSAPDCARDVSNELVSGSTERETKLAT